MPARMPEHRLKDNSGPQTVGEIPVGGSAFTWLDTVKVTPERETWVYLNAGVFPENGLFLVRIDRTEAGYCLVIPAVASECERVVWEPKPLADTKGYAPIIEIVEEGEEGN